MRETKEAKLARLLEREKALLEAGATVAGIDEVGRGPLAGPVVAACVAMKPGCWVPGVDDSKKLTEKRREALYPLILQNSLYARTAWVWPGEIDALNILNATRRAMEEAARGLPGAIFLVDAVTGLDLPGANRVHRPWRRAVLQHRRGVHRGKGRARPLYGRVGRALPAVWLCPKQGLWHRAAHGGLARMRPLPRAPQKFYSIFSV